MELYGVLAFPLAAFYDFFLRKKKIVRISILIVAILLVALNLFQVWQFENGCLHYSYMTKKSYWLGFLKTEVSGEWWLSLQKPNNELAKRGLPEYYYDSTNLYHIRQLIDFEENCGDSAFCSSAIASSGKHSFLLQGESVFSPAIVTEAEEVVHVSPAEAITSAKFYFKKEPLDTNELILVISFSSDTGVYYYNTIDLLTSSPRPGRWNTITTKLELGKVKNEKDKIGIYFWSRNPKREFFIDDLTLESIYPKD